MDRARTRGPVSTSWAANPHAGPLALLVLGASACLPACSPVIDIARAGEDASRACAPGLDETCNDDRVSWYEGRCVADGTCACYSGYETNPATGRCRMIRATSDAPPP